MQILCTTSFNGREGTRLSTTIDNDLSVVGNLLTLSAQTRSHLVSGHHIVSRAYDSNNKKALRARVALKSNFHPSKEVAPE